MRGAYALLGVLFLILIVGTFFLSSRTFSPEEDKSFIQINEKVMSTLSLTSSAFENSGTIPSKYTCDGNNTSPPLEIGSVPEDARSLALLVDDPDIPQVFKDSRGIEDFDHWALINVSPKTETIAGNTTPQGAVIGKNSAGNNSYTGPCPPTEYEPTEHRYIFKLYALDTVLSLSDGASHEEIKEAMKGHILEETELVGLYNRAR